MDEKDHFVERMQPFTDMDKYYDVEDRFGTTPNPKTLGLMLVRNSLKYWQLSYIYSLIRFAVYYLIVTILILR